MVSRSWIAIGVAAIFAGAGVSWYGLSRSNDQALDLVFESTPVTTATDTSRSEADRLAHIPAASDSALSQIARQRRDLLVILAKEDAGICADQYYGDFPGNELDRLPEASKAAARQHRAMLLAAAGQGENSPVNRAPFDESLNDRITRLIAEGGATKRQIELAAGAAPRTSAESCDAGVLIYSAVASLPSEQAGAWMAQVLDSAVDHRRSVERRLVAPGSLTAEFALELKEVSLSHFERLIDAYVLRENGAPDSAAKAADRLFPELRDRLRSSPPDFSEIWQTAQEFRPGYSFGVGLRPAATSTS